MPAGQSVSVRSSRPVDSQLRSAEVAQVEGLGEEAYAVVVVSVDGAAGAGEANGDHLPGVLGRQA